MIARAALVFALLALAVRLWWSGRPAVREYVGQHRQADPNPHRPTGSPRRPLAALVGDYWRRDALA